MKLWIPYLLAALATLACKYVRYIYEARRLGKSVKEASVEWLVEPSAENAVSWLTTIAVVWVVGAVYIDSVADYLAWIPRHPSFAFLLGLLAEVCAPAITKWLVSRAVATITQR